MMSGMSPPIKSGMVWLYCSLAVSRDEGGGGGAIYNFHTDRSAEPPKIWGGGKPTSVI